MTEERKELDQVKWGSPATSAELATGLLQVRLGIHAVMRVVVAQASGDPEEIKRALAAADEEDARLKQIINDVGGLSYRSY
jgi:mRNA-degrading endonuclease HigB of HigAB toxin-antitoxin module